MPVRLRAHARLNTGDEGRRFYSKLRITRGQRSHTIILDSVTERS